MRLIRRQLVAIAERRQGELEVGSERHDLWVRMANGWAGCGWASLYRVRQTGTLVGLPDHCDKPLCPYCERRRVGPIRDRYRPRHDEALADKRLFLATLTIPNVPLGCLAEGYERIRIAIARLRRQRWWQELVIGGLWRLEHTVNLRTRTWHPHANLLLETNRRVSMRNFLQEAVQEGWRRALGEAGEQWAWLVEGWAGALPEAVKRQVAWEVKSDAGSGEQLRERDALTSIDYAAKPPGAAGWVDAADPSWVVEYVETQHRRRHVAAFGAWRKLPPAKPEHADELVVEAPWTPGDDPFARRVLPRFDPTRPLAGALPAEWEFVGRGPRYLLRPQRPPDGGTEWLVWRPGEAEDPATAEDELPITGRPHLTLRGGP